MLHVGALLTIEKRPLARLFFGHTRTRGFRGNLGKSRGDFDRVVMPIRDLVEERNLSKGGPDEATFPDDAMIDRIFQAGFELAAQSGTCCISTGRIIRSTEEDTRPPREDHGDSEGASMLREALYLKVRSELVELGLVL